MIVLELPDQAEEHVLFELSRLGEAVHSWHVLANPGRHALQLPWVRQCRALPATLRAELRAWSWVVEDYVPAVFEAGAGLLEGTWEEELERVAALPAGAVAVQLAETVLFGRERDPAIYRDPEAAAAAVTELAGSDPVAAGRLEQVLTDPLGLLRHVLELLGEYWDRAFGAEWERLEPRLLDAVGRAGAGLPGGLVPLLKQLVPAIRVDQEARTVALDRPHDHHVVIRGGDTLRLVPSLYSWPHVRVTCDPPWPLRITYPVVPPSPFARWQRTPAELLGSLRALAASSRLEILRLLRAGPRSTQELSGLLGLSAAAVSRHLHELRDAGLVGTRREGYYVLYTFRRERLRALAEELAAFAEE